MDRIKVLFSFQPWDALRNYIETKLKYLTNIELIYPPDTEKETIENLVDEADILFGWRPWKELIERAANLKLIIQPGTGAERLVEVMKDFKDRGIVLTNGHGHSYGCAQHAVALLHTLTNFTSYYHNSMKEGKWRERTEESIILKNRRIGLLGFGPINQWVHRFLQGYDLEFNILKRSWENDTNPAKAKKFVTSELHGFLKETDFLIIALPLTDLTNNLIGFEELQLLGENGILVTVARGQIINQKALYEALKTKTIHSAGIDVWYNYSPEVIDGKAFPYDKKYPFHELSNVILSPHRAGSLRGDLSRWNENIENIQRMATGRTDYINIVDIDRGY